MINKVFEKNLLNLVFDNSLSNKKLLEASELYLYSNINIIEKATDAILFDIDGVKINVVYQNNRVLVYKNDMVNYLDEYTVACLMYYKRELYIKDEVVLKQEDLQINQYYYNNYFITKVSYEQYQARFNFYFGIIDKLYDLGIMDYCVKVMVELFSTLDTKFSYESKYLEKEKYNLFRIIKDKFNVLYEYPNEIINNFGYKNYPITTLGKLLYVACINKATILKNSNIKIIYEYVFDNYLKFLKTTQLYRDLTRQYNIIKWYNKEIDNSFIENNLDYYDVVCIYINELYEKEDYKKICNIFKENKINKVTNDLMYKIIGAFYKCSLYNEAINLFKLMKNITFDIYMNYKNDYPLLFTQDYIESIIENIIENDSDEEILKILDEEKIEDYKLLVIAKKDFRLIDDKFYEYKGKYDNQLIKIYQKEIYNNLLTIRGYYARTPFEIISKLDKLNELKNGKYYIIELINCIKHKAFLSFYDELEEYCEGLGI